MQRVHTPGSAAIFHMELSARLHIVLHWTWCGLLQLSCFGRREVMASSECLPSRPREAGWLSTSWARVRWPLVAEPRFCWATSATWLLHLVSGSLPPVGVSSSPVAIQRSIVRPDCGSPHGSSKLPLIRQVPRFILPRSLVVLPPSKPSGWSFLPSPVAPVSFQGWSVPALSFHPPPKPSGCILPSQPRCSSVQS